MKKTLVLSICFLTSLTSMSAIWFDGILNPLFYEITLDNNLIALRSDLLKGINHQKNLTVQNGAATPEPNSGYPSPEGLLYARMSRDEELLLEMDKSTLAESLKIKFSTLLEQNSKLVPFSIDSFNRRYPGLLKTVATKHKVKKQLRFSEELISVLASRGQACWFE